MSEAIATPIENTALNPSGADSMNPPVSPSYIDAAFAKEAAKRNKSIKAELTKINSSFEKIAFNLHWFYSNSAYSQLGYKTIYELAAKEYGIAKGTTNNFVNVVERFAERDADGNILEHIRPELKDFSSSKLIALLGVLNDEQLNEFESDMSVREIKAKVKELNEEPGEASDETNAADSDNGEESTIDVESVEINRQTVIAFSTLAEYNEYLDSMNDLIEKNLKSKAFKNGDKRIEIAIVW